MDPIIYYVITQYGIKGGLQKFLMRGEEAINKELRQIDDMITSIPLDASQLTFEDRRKAVPSLIFLMEM